MLRIAFFFLLLFCVNIHKTLAQAYFTNTKISTQAGFIASTAKTSPFLLRSNQYGVVPFESNLAYLGASIHREYDSLFTIDKKQNRFGFGYGLASHVNMGNVNQVLLPEAYVKLRFKSIEIYGGRRKEIQGLVDTTGTMGSYIWSGNALPLPKVEISIPNYTPILGAGLLSIKGNFAHGWFGSTDSVKNYWLHQKSLYMRIGKPTWKFKFFAGFNHQVQWGGRPAKPYYDEASKQVISKYGSDFANFVNVVSGYSLASLDKGFDGIPGAPANEAGNRTGNHLGTIDIAAELNTKVGRFYAYRQNIYDDGSLFYLNNISDGLNGISFTPISLKMIRKITFEYLNTTNQGGSYFYDNRSELRGRDNYFNNSIYKDGWVYKDNVIGSPLFTNRSKIQNSKKDLNVLNNKIEAISVTLNFQIKQVNFISKIINYQNKGSFVYEILKSQTSLSQCINFPMRNYTILTNIAGDLGYFWQDSFGLKLGIIKNFSF